jgi:F0F1-type ATP synthase membrane subunit b/b'
MFLQDNDPHHMHPDFNYVYVFIVLAVIWGVAMLFAAPKLMNYLDNRY